MISRSYIVYAPHIKQIAWTHVMPNIKQHVSKQLTISHFVFDFSSLRKQHFTLYSIHCVLLYHFISYPLLFWLHMFIVFLLSCQDNKYKYIYDHFAVDASYTS